MNSRSDRPFDVVVLGAGPAGSHAALTAAVHDLSVLMIDEGPQAGGQIWRAPSTAASMRLSSGDVDRITGDAVRAQLADSTVQVINNAVVWSVTTESQQLDRRFRIDLFQGERSITVYASQLVSALGAVERVVPFPGWTLPGVFGLAAATALLKRDGCLPGVRMGVAGQGPLLMAVAAKAFAAGLPPRVVIDVARRREWLHAAVGFSSSPGQLWRGTGWLAALARAGIPYSPGSAVVAAHGTERLEAIDVAPLHPDGTPQSDKTTRYQIDTLFIGNGLSPVAEVPRMLGATTRYDPLRGGFSVVRDRFGRTGVPGLLAAGDGAGVNGAIPALLAGSLAGLACAMDAGRLSGQQTERLARPLMRRGRRAESCADASCRLMKVSSARMASMPQHTVVCRCELVTREAIDSAAQAGIRHLDELKTTTRLGMGPCQGRMCAINAAALLSLHTGNQAGIGLLTQRVPLQPIPVDQLVGSFDYNDIPVPAPAPL